MPTDIVKNGVVFLPGMLEVPSKDSDSFWTLVNGEKNDNANDDANDDANDIDVSDGTMEVNSGANV